MNRVIFSLPKEIFDTKSSISLMHQVVVAQLAAARQGTHKVKNRAEVFGSGKKPFKQKGTGRARQGSIRAPHMKGGGVVHGPTPRSYAQRTPKKMITAALYGALSDRARNGFIHIIDNVIQNNIPSTKSALSNISNIILGKRSLVILDREDSISMMSLRNIKNIHTIFFDQLNAYDVLVADDIVFTKSALDSFISKQKIKQNRIRLKNEI